MRKYEQIAARRNGILKCLASSFRGEEDAPRWLRAYDLGNSYSGTLHSDLKALCKLGLAERKKAYMGISSGHWEYRITSKGLEEVDKNKEEQEFLSEHKKMADELFKNTVREPGKPAILHASKKVRKLLERL